MTLCVRVTVKATLVFFNKKNNELIATTQRLQCLSAALLVGGVAQLVSGVRRVNEVNPRRSRLVLGWVTVYGRVYRLDNNQPTGQISLASLLGGLIEYKLRLG